MGGLSWWHWMIVLAAFVLLFGAKKLPEAARGVGRSLRILKSEVGAMNADEPGDAVPSGDTVAPPAPPVSAAVSSHPVAAPVARQPSTLHVPQADPALSPAPAPAPVPQVG